MAVATTWRCAPLLSGFVLAVLPVTVVRAQVPAGDGVVGEYYEGVDFERLVTRRYDATLAFDWGHAPPVPGVPAEYFSVRWRGWLLVPVSGRYVLHATVDDGVRIWLNDQLVLNEWRPQPVRTFTISVELKAGQPYKLRVDYYQDILDTSMRITWKRPNTPLTPPPTSWRNLWGLTAEMPRPEPIPTRFLFSRNPLPTARPRVAVRRPPPPKLFDRVYLAPITVITPGARARRPVATAPPVAIAAAPAAAPAVVTRPAVDSATTTRLAQLAVGETLTTPKLYFDQGQARLLPPARALRSMSWRQPSAPGPRCSSKCRATPTMWAAPS